MALTISSDIKIWRISQCVSVVSQMAMHGTNLYGYLWECQHYKEWKYSNSHRLGPVDVLVLLIYGLQLTG